MDLASEGISVVVLGITQDAGVPHAGCRCSRCSAAYDDPSLIQYVASLAILDTRRSQSKTWLIDATPDIKNQLNLLRSILGPQPDRTERLRQPDGIFITHAHMGHTSGLVQLGIEGMAVRDLKIYASVDLVRIIRETRLWEPLLDNLALVHLEPGLSLELAPHLTITPIAVPHRDELSAGTFAYRIEGMDRSLIYLPDIDNWELWPGAREVMATADVALVDASFYSRHELEGRTTVAHPLVPETLAFFEEMPGQLVLTHMNHTNPLLDENSEERRAVDAAGGLVAFTGQVFEL